MSPAASGVPGRHYASERVVGELHERLAAGHQRREVPTAARQHALHVEAGGGELGLVEGDVGLALPLHRR